MSGLSLAKLPLESEIQRGSVKRGYWILITDASSKYTGEKILKEASQKVSLNYQYPTILELAYVLLTRKYDQLLGRCTAFVAEGGDLLTSDGRGHIYVSQFPVLMGTMAVHRVEKTTVALRPKEMST